MMKSTRKEMTKTTGHQEQPSDAPKTHAILPNCPSHGDPQATNPKMGKVRSNTSIIAMLNPSRHIFRDWTPQPFSVHEDVGLEVGKEIIRKIAEALGHPMPATPLQKIHAK
jgi:hypothetical protein